MTTPIDASSSVSESATQGSSIASPFSVGGGLKIPDWVWSAGLIVVVVALAAGVAKMFKKN